MPIASTNTREPMLETVLTIINPLGLHARAASKFVDAAKHFESTITLVANDNEVDGQEYYETFIVGCAGRHPDRSSRGRCR